MMMIMMIPLDDESGNETALFWLKLIITSPVVANDNDDDNDNNDDDNDNDNNDDDDDDDNDNDGNT